ncbi:hypothetical protein KR093_006801, partial [Drosophila rubida]
EAVVFKFSNAICESYNQSWVVIHTCRINAISRNKNAFNFNATVLYPCNHIFIDVQLFKKANGYKPWLYKITIDACRFVKKTYNPIAILIYKLFKDYSNINHTCPYVGPQILKGFHLQPDKLGLTLPSGDYLLGLTWFFNRRKTVTTNVYFIFTEDL